MKTCAACKSPAKCKAAGKCLAKSTATAKAGGVMKYAAGKSTKLPMVEKNGKMVPAFAADGKGKMAKGGKTKVMAKGGKAKGYKAGGSSKIDGCAMRGKTRGTSR